MKWRSDIFWKIGFGFGIFSSLFFWACAFLLSFFVMFYPQHLVCVVVWCVCSEWVAQPEQARLDAASHLSLNMMWRPISDWRLSLARNYQRCIGCMFVVCMVCVDVDVCYLFVHVFFCGDLVCYISDFLDKTRC